MGTATIPPTLLSLALVGWLGAATVCTAASAAKGQGTSPAQASQAAPPQAVPPQGAPAEPIDRASSATPRNAVHPAGGREKRRRTSYASCNRESHRRNLRGGARRRFLIRCRLGYERRQPPAAQGAAQGRGQSQGQGQVQGQPPARRP